ncbi:alpha/beta hydrolase [Pseudonocardia thermophila]|uniref:alpha/beta hydrolase n=1 Tax=Pseudonocardia thermophila TaxID=1848 RepID=UPI00248D5042|nr:alpha/beta hydrolase [Pseudonocardia thermophila]
MRIFWRALCASLSILAVGAAPAPATVRPVAAAATGDPALAPYYTQRLNWGSCTPLADTDEDRVTFADPRFDCTFLTVPLDYVHPDGRQAKIAMMRVKATDPARRIGTVFTDPGGPGGSGVEFLPRFADGVRDTAVAQRFDLVGFDPRGVGKSTPTIDCSTTAEIDAERADLDLDPSPEGVAQTEAENREFARRCADRVGLDVLANVGTRDVARDLHIAHRVLGDDRLTYVGYSYGTRIGAEYAAQFPADVRALVLDGAIDPSLGPVESRVTQSRGFQRTFDNFAAACAEQSGCPLGSDPAKASARLQEILRPLIDEPVPAEPGRVLGYTDAMTGVFAALYSEAAWGFLAQGIAQVEQGRGTNLLRLADIYYERDPKGDYSNLLEAFQAINCVDSEPVTDPETALLISAESLRLAPFTDAGFGPSAARELCAFWPVPPTSKAGPVVAPGLPPTIVVSSTGDPATPYEDGVALARQMGARLVSVEHDSHTVVLQKANACADEIAVRYLVDLQLPEGDVTCARQR